MTLVIAHRGACWELPENTLAAFERAIEVGADFVEFDVHATSDGELVVCHDRPLGGELRLEEAVEALRGQDRGHVRAEDARGATADTTSSRGASRSCPTTPSSLSFDARALRGACAVGACSSTSASAPRSRRGRGYAWGVGLPRPPRDAARARKARALGLVTTVYTVNEPDRMRELAALGVDGIFSDRPDLLRRALAAPPG